MEGERSSPADDVVVKPAAAVMHSNRQKKSRTPARSKPSFSLRMWTTHFALDGADALLCRLSSNGSRGFNSNDNHLRSGALNFPFAALTSPQPHSRLQLRSLASTAAASSSSASIMTRWMRPELWSSSVLGLCGFLGLVIVPCASSSSRSIVMIRRTRCLRRSDLPCGCAASSWSATCTPTPVSGLTRQAGLQG
ncbi:unnamed protein product [Musa hybrid cultivar]